MDEGQLQGCCRKHSEERLYFRKRGSKAGMLPSGHLIALVKSENSNKRRIASSFEKHRLTGQESGEDSQIYLQLPINTFEVSPGIQC